LKGFLLDIFAQEGWQNGVSKKAETIRLVLRVRSIQEMGTPATIVFRTDRLS